MKLINHIEIKEFYYDSEEERNNHRKEMVKDKWNTNEKFKENIGNITNPKYVWYGYYYRYLKINN